jgi:acyl-CoA thioester hydrolase
MLARVGLVRAEFDCYGHHGCRKWFDPNRHMNMAYYMVAFDKATDVLLEQLGLSYAYTRHGWA